MGHGVLVRYCNFLPITPSTPIITLGEGDTPLVRSVSLEKDSAAVSSISSLRAATPPALSKTGVWW